jgi:N-acylneuraminate cytidylyltransferase
MRVLAVIPARGGSKGIPNKNILPIGGRPLLGRTIQAVRSCPLVNDVVVTTDSRVIAELARHYGADVVERPQVLAGDQVSSEAALLHACADWEQRTGFRYDLLLLPQNTSPFHDGADIEKIITMMSSGSFNSCITVVRTYRYFWNRREDDTAWMMHQKRAPRQQRSPLYEEAGSLYCVRYDHFQKTGNLFADPTGLMEVPWWKSVELDEPSDVELAELVCAMHDGCAAAGTDSLGLTDECSRGNRER